METIGAKLRQIRESKNLTIKQIAADTNISLSYIEALESEDFDRFPGETYIIGFIRSYAEYLRIEPDEIIKAYRGYKIGESDTPLEELTRPSKAQITGPRLDVVVSMGRTVLIVALFLALIVAGFFLIKTYVGSMISSEKDDSIDRIKTDYAETDKQDDFERIRNLKLTKNKGFVLAYKKEAVQFLVDTKECIFTLEEIAGTTALIKLFPEKTDLTLEMDRSVKAEFPGVEREVYITLRGLTENRAKIMVTLGGEIAESTGDGSEGEIATQEKDSSKVEATDKNNLKIVFEAIFQSKTYLELYLDGQQKARGIIQAGTSERWEANEYIQLKVGNAGGMKAKINGKDYVFGLNGQVANKIITWTKDPSDPNVYHIVVKDW